MRNLTTAVQNAITGSAITTANLVDLMFANTPVYVWSGYGDFVYNGNTYKGVGSFGKISEYTETAELSANGLTLTLSGLDNNLIAYAMEVTDRYKGRPCIVRTAYIQNINSTDYTLLNVDYTFVGRMDQMVIQEGEKGATVNITVENDLLDLQRARPRYYTQQDQNAEYPGDSGFAFMQALQDIKLPWGDTTVSTASPTYRT